MKERAYRMTARAESTAATEARVLEAAMAAFDARPYDEVTLEEVARAAGVTPMTVRRKFESKDGLFLAAWRAAGARIAAQRGEAPVGDVRGAVANVVTHYEEWGDSVVRQLAQEDRVPMARELVRHGRALHRRWVERTLAPSLACVSGAARRRRRAQLVALTDVYAWKLLRRDQRLSREETERAMVEMIEALVAGGHR